MALAAMDEAVGELEGAIAGMMAAMAQDCAPADLEALAEALTAAATALDAASADYAALEGPPEFLSEVPEAFRTPEAESAALPATSGRDHAVLLVRDPESIFTWWELTAAGVGRARAAEGGELVLRTYLLGDDDAPSEIRDLVIEDWIGSRTIAVDRPGQRVVTAVGFRSVSGFQHVAQSSAVRMPRRNPGTGAVRFARPGPPTAQRPGPEPEGEWAIVQAARNQLPVVAAPRADSEALRRFALGEVEGAPEQPRVMGSNHLEPRR